MFTLGEVATFEARLYEFPSHEVAQEYFRWRQEEANVASIDRYCTHVLSQSGADVRSSIDAARQNTPSVSGNIGNTRGIGGEREVGISGSSIGATQNSKGGENALGGERRQPSPPAGGVEGTRGEERA